MNDDAEIIETSRNDAESEEGTSDGRWLLLDIRLLIALFGIAACWAVFFILLLTRGFVLPGASTNDIVLAQLGFLIGIIALLAVVWALSDLITRHRDAALCVSFIVCLIGSLGMVTFASAGIALFISSAVMGAGFAILYSLYGEFLSQAFSYNLEDYVRIIGLASASLVFLAFLVEKDALYIVSFAILLIAFAGYFISVRVFRLLDAVFVPRDISDSRSHISSRSYLSTVISGLVIGYPIGILMSIEDMTLWQYITIGVVCCGVCLFNLLDSLNEKSFTEKKAMAVFLPIVACAAFPLMFVSVDSRCVLAALLLGWALIPTLLSISAVCVHIKLYDLAGVRVFSFGRIMSILGILLGLLLGLIGFTPVFYQSQPPEAINYSVTLFMLLVIFAASFVMTEDNYPHRFRFHDVDDGNQTDCLVVENDEQTVENPSKQEGESNDGLTKYTEVEALEERCGYIVEKYGLSSRQAEVLVLLAKGRNADYISRALVVSPHTAKAHIYNIYRKLDIHSHQDLLDLVDSVESRAR